MSLRGAAAQATIPLRTGRPRLVILGTGWGGARLLRDIDPSKYDVTVISPRNHFVFTPLLSSTCVGTLEARAVTLSVVDLQKAIKAPQNFYYAAEAVAVHPEDKIVEACSRDGIKFFVDYDVLAISTGSQGSTFGIPGVSENAHFLRDAANADAIRTQLINNWNRANIPGRSLQERERILHTVVVGGGPTGVEFAGDLAHFINGDLHRIDPGRAQDMRVTLIEADQLLGSFDARLREYAAKKLSKAGIHLIKAIVKEVRENEIELKDGSVVPYGLCVWSTGVGPTPFTLSLPFLKTPKGRLAVNERLQVLMPRKASSSAEESAQRNPTAGASSGTPVGGAATDGGTSATADSGPTTMSEVSIDQDEEPAAGESGPQGIPLPDVVAMGDCCANADTPLPALAQVAEQQGKFLAKVLNERAAKGGLGTTAQAESTAAARGLPQKFVYRSVGAMATVGGRSAVIELQGRKDKTVSWAGFSSFIAWRSAYLTRLGSFKARLYVATNWTMTLLFGRDISRW